MTPFTRPAILTVVGGLYEVTTADYKVSGVREYGHGGGETDRRMLLKARLRANKDHLSLHDGSSHSERGQWEKQVPYWRLEHVNGYFSKFQGYRYQGF